MIKVGVAGAAGYAAGELIRILLHHPEVELTCLQSESHKGEPIYRVHRDLLYSPLIFSEMDFSKIDLLFLCMGHGVSASYLSKHDIPERLKIIDLSNDFRLNRSANGFIYGLPELSREKITQGRCIANPGCFATAIELSLLPLAAMNRFPEKISVFGITGSTGAGQKPTEDTHFSHRNNNLSNYKVFTHQHMAEIYETFNQAGVTTPYELSFVPTRGCHSRGIFVNTLMHTDCSKEELVRWYQSYYASHPFVVVSEEPLYLKQVVNTNYCYLHITQQGKQTLITSVIDNLLKGASGQAVQNMNLLFGWEETSGLRLKANYL